MSNPIELGKTSYYKEHPAYYWGFEGLHGILNTPKEMTWHLGQEHSKLSDAYFIHFAKKH